jgi:trigger factor
MMQSTLKRLDPTQVELEFVVPAADLERARDQAYRELSRNARIAGFRPGKAPRKIFEAAYGTAGIEERALDRVVPDAYAKAVAENDLEPVERPQVELMPAEEAAGGDLRLRATVTVRPEIALGEYKGLEVTAPDTSVSDDEVARDLETLRRGAAELAPVDRPVQAGDVATLDFVGTVDGEPFPGGSAQGQATEIREDRFIPGFAAGIFGMKAGETKEVEAEFPAGYPEAALAGKKAVFTVTVHEVKEPQLPALDDAFATRFLRDGTIDRLRSDLRGRLERDNEERARRAMTAELLEKLRSAHDVPLPESLVEREAATLYEDAQRQVTRAGIAWEDYLRESSRDDATVRAEMREEAERRVKTGFLVERIARAEGIEATQTDVDAELASLSSQYGQPKDQIAAALGTNMDALVDGIVRSKTIEFLLSHARRVEATRTPAS